MPNPMGLSTLTPQELQKIDAYWRAANYLSAGQIYLCDNPLLREPLALSHVRRLLLGHRMVCSHPVCRDAADRIQRQRERSRFHLRRKAQIRGQPELRCAGDAMYTAG
jgi:phosphoketolase